MRTAGDERASRQHIAWSPLVILVDKVDAGTLWLAMARGRREGKRDAGRETFPSPIGVSLDVHKGIRDTACGF